MNLNCSGCGEVIESGTVLNAFEMTWHPACLVCNVCGKDFSDNSVLCEGEDGFAYCQKHFTETFTNKCAGCGEAIVGEMLEAVGKKWHPGHFVCGTCKVNLDKNFFSGEDGIPYCEIHYYQSIGLICAECEKPIITGKCVQFLEVKYHPEHFKCSYCKKNLLGQQYLKQNSKPYCKNCHIALFG